MRRTPIVDERTGANLRHVFLYPGTLHCKREPCAITTVLGSCVAVCLTDRSRSISGINHFMLPRGGKDSSCLRHGDTAIAALAAKMFRLGCRVEDIEAKIFGGAAVLPVSNPGDAVGTKNVAVALECLRGLDIAVIARRTGGKTGMLVRLFTATGDVLVRKVASSVEWQSDGEALEQGRRLSA